MTCPVFTLQRKKQDFVHQIFLFSIINWSWICRIRQFLYQSHSNLTSQLLYTRKQAFKNSLGLSLWPRHGKWRLSPPSVSLLQRIYQKAKERVSLSALCNTFHSLTTASQLVGARLQTSEPTKQLQGGFNSAPYISLWPILPRDSKQQLFFFPVTRSLTGFKAVVTIKMTISVRVTSSNHIHKCNCLPGVYYQVQFSLCNKVFYFILSVQNLFYFILYSYFV